MAVLKRKAYYISGFDDRGAEHYRAMYLSQCRKQSENATYSIQSDAIGEDAWRIQLTDTDQKTSTLTDFRFIQWQHVMAPTMRENPVALWWHALEALTGYLTNGFLLRTRRTAPLFAFSIFLAMGWTLLTPLLAISLVVAIAAGWLPPVSGVLTGLGLGGLLWWIYKKFYPLWITRAFVFNGQAARNSDILMSELKQQARLIAQDIEQGEADEYLLIGHCYGSTLLPIILAELASVIRSSKKTVSVLYLAQTAPMLQWTSDWYPRQMRRVPFEALDCVDYSSPADGLCYPQLESQDLDQNLDDQTCILKSPRFHTLFDADHYARIVRRNKFRIHFQYLLSSHKTDVYDYFYMTAGPMRLKDYALSR